MTLVLVMGAFLGPAPAIRAEQMEQGDAVVRLLNLFSARTDPLAVANAGKLLSKGGSPAEVLAANLHAPLPSLGGWNSPETTQLQARQLGEYVAEHAGELAGKLPSPSSIADPLRLEPFFVGLFQPTLASSGSSSHFQKDLARLSSLLDDAWLKAAAACGAANLQQLTLAHRGELSKLLRSYQKSEDDIALIHLGETLASYSQAYRQIEPREFQPRTLALLLAGSLGAQHSDPDEQLDIVLTAARWSREHPELMGMLREMREPASLSLLETVVLWPRDREASITRLSSIHWFSPWTRARLAMRLFEDPLLSESEAASLIRLLPTEILIGWLKRSKSEDSPTAPARDEEWINSELHSRNESGKPSR